MDTRDSIIREVTHEYLASVDKSNLPEPKEVAASILLNIKNQFDIHNSVVQRDAKWKVPDRLIPAQIGDIIVALHPVVAIETGSTNCDADLTLLGLYQTEGKDEGIYVTDDKAFFKLAREYYYGTTLRELDEVFNNIRSFAPRVQPCREPNLIAVNNGIFDYDTKQLLPFTPDLVFMSKSRIDYNPMAQNITIHNDDDGTDWDVESWMNELSDDPEIVNTLWEVTGAVVRPNVPWGKAAWFYSESGNNGKGTLCSMFRNLLGDGSHCSISLSNMGKDFMLEPMLYSVAIIVDENDVGTYIDKAANLKAIVTGDVIQINRKFKTPIPYQFKGFMVQCLNEMPRVKDKSDSFFRRQLFIPFTKCFTGAERKYIKQDYLKRKEVLEYILYKVLNMNYYELSTPQACKNALAEYKSFNDPVRQFMDEIMEQLTWDLVPFTFLYDLYKAWYKRNVGDKDTKSSQVFIRDVLNILSEYPEWMCEDKTKKYRPGNTMDKPEPLIWDYKLEDWYNPNYKGGDVNKICHPALKTYYRGIVRA